MSTTEALVLKQDNCWLVGILVCVHWSESIKMAKKSSKSGTTQPSYIKDKRMPGEESYLCSSSWFALWDVQEILVSKVNTFSLVGFRNTNLAASFIRNLNFFLCFSNRSL